VLWVHSLFADVAWKTQKKVNFGLNWISFLLIPLTIFFFLRRELGTLVFGTGIMAISGIWQFNVERGQQYSYLALILTLAVLGPTTIRRAFTAAAPVLRSTLGLSLFLCFREKRMIRAILITSALGMVFLLPTLLKYPLTWWLDYLASAKDWYLHRMGMHEHIPVVGSFTFPATPEGDAQMSGAFNFAAPGNIFHHYLMKLGLPLIPYGVSMISVMIGTVLSAWMLWKNRFENNESYALRFFSSIYVIDMLLPSPRSAYNGTLFFPILLLALLKTELLASRIVLFGAVFALGAIESPYSSPHMVETSFFFAALCFLFKASSAFQDPVLQPSDPRKP